MHVHAILGHPEDLNSLSSPVDWTNFCRLHFGFARVQKIRRKAKACAYVAKQVLKGRDLEPSMNLGAVPPTT